MHFYRIIFLLLNFFFLPTLTHAEALLRDSQGNEIVFSSLKGKWVYINYWASWCPTCLEEIPEFNLFYEQQKKNTVALYAVNFDGLPQTQQQALIKRFNIRYPSLIEDPSTELRLGDIRGIPVTFIFNPDGQLVKTLYGGQTKETLNKIMDNA